jgi:hypothetical protein
VENKFDRRYIINDRIMGFLIPFTALRAIRESVGRNPIYFLLEAVKICVPIRRLHLKEYSLRLSYTDELCSVCVDLGKYTHFGAQVAAFSLASRQGVSAFCSAGRGK